MVVFMFLRHAISTWMSRKFSNTLARLLSNIWGGLWALLLCVLLGAVVGGADIFPNEIVPCSFAWTQLCPALEGCIFPSSLM